MKPQLVVDDYRGRHNANPRTPDRIFQGNTYKDCSTICVIPTRGVIPARVVQSWWGMISPMNQRFIRMFMIGMEVGEAYSQAIESILANQELSKWKYVLTLEEDNMPPPDGLLKLLESIKDYDAVQGIYWTKGEGGQPMIYGKPGDMPKNFIPWLPPPETIAQCNGLGMGFTLFRMSMLKDPKIERPLFKTIQEYIPNQGTRMFTQDLRFFENAGKLGYRFACDTRCKIGHYDYEGTAGPPDTIW